MQPIAPRNVQNKLSCFLNRDALKFYNRITLYNNKYDNYQE